MEQGVGLERPAGQHQGERNMFLENGFHRRSNPDRLYSLEQDIRLIRQDLISVLQETASVRATMTEFSSRRPIASKRFIVVCGVLCFFVVAGLVIYHDAFQAWFDWKN